MKSQTPSGNIEPGFQFGSQSYILWKQVSPAYHCQDQSPYRTIKQRQGSRRCSGSTLNGHVASTEARLQISEFSPFKSLHLCSTKTEAVGLFPSMCFDARFEYSLRKVYGNGQNLSKLPLVHVEVARFKCFLPRSAVIVSGRL